jgi:hypothetical protein
LRIKNNKTVFYVAVPQLVAASPERMVGRVWENCGGGKQKDRRHENTPDAIPFIFRRQGRRRRETPKAR